MFRQEVRQEELNWEDFRSNPIPEIVRKIHNPPASQEPETAKLSQLFVGREEVSVDSKNRLSMPSSMRESFVDRCLYMTRSPEGSLWMFTTAEFRRILAELERVERPNDPFTAALKEVFCSKSCCVEMDNQSRVMLPRPFRDHLLGDAGQSSAPQAEPESGKKRRGGHRVVLVGAGNLIEVWGKRQWLEHVEELKRVVSKPLSESAPESGETQTS